MSEAGVAAPEATSTAGRPTLDDLDPSLGITERVQDVVRDFPA